MGWISFFLSTISITIFLTSSVSVSGELSGQLASIQAYLSAARSSSSPDAAVTPLNNAYSAMYNITGSGSPQYANEMRQQISGLSKQLYDTRISLRGISAKVMESGGEMSPQLRSALADNFRSLRYLEEAASSCYSGTPPIPPGEDNMARRAQENQRTRERDKLVSPDPNAAPLSAGTLNAGDILVMRGTAGVSSAIARLGQDRAQFSHAAMITQGADGKKYVVEALIESGVVRTELSAWLNSHQSLARLAVYSPKDGPFGACAADASTWLNSQVDAAKAAGRQIPYNFSMSEQGEGFYCAQLIQKAYKNTKCSAHRLPLTQSIFPSDHRRNILRKIGVPDSTTTIFSPSDMEFDSRFKVREYRNLARTDAARVNDLIMDKIIDTVNKENLTPQNSQIVTKLGQSIVERLQVAKSRNPGLENAFQGIGSWTNTQLRNVPSGALNVMNSMNQTQALVMAELADFVKTKSNRGLLECPPMSPKEISGALDEMLGDPKIREKVMVSFVNAEGVGANSAARR